MQPGAVLAGTYVVERLLGEGGMGAVVAARHIERRDMVALKFMLPTALSFPQAAQRFFREGAVLSQLTGINTPRVLDMGMLDNGAPYLALEYLDGVDLAKLVRQYGPLSVRDAVDFMLQACAGMAEAHEHGVIHRDLKPGNLFLTQRDDGSPLVKVLDFGLSKILHENDDELLDSASQTQTTGTMGTPAYMSPEQARSAKHVDERSDVWSLGAILYYLLSARLPFSANATAEAFAKVLYEPHEPLCQVAPWVQPELEYVVDLCLKKDRMQRYQSVAELARVLEPFRGKNEPASEPRVMVHSPRKIDVRTVLQQRTTVQGIENVSPLALAGTLVHRDIEGMAPVRSRRLTTALLAAFAGMIIGAIIIVFLATMTGGRSRTVPARSVPAAPPSDLRSSAAPEVEPVAPAAAPAASSHDDQPAEPERTPAGDAASRLPGREPAAPSTRRPGSSPSRSRSRPGKAAAAIQAHEKAYPPQASEDPFGTMD